MAKIAPSRRTSLLNGIWRYRTDPDNIGETQHYYDQSPEGEVWPEVPVPSHWYKTEIGDYHGVIWFSRTFEVDSILEDDECFVRFEAVDYIADVWLNGSYLGRHEGYFSPFTFCVTDLVRETENCLVVKVDSPLDPTEYRLVDRPDLEGLVSDPYKMRWPVGLTTIKGAQIHFYHRPGWETQFGQDGNTGGIWQDVRFYKTGRLTIQNMKIYTKIVEKNGNPDGTALLSVDLNILNAHSEPQRTSISIEAWGKNFDEPERLEKTVERVLVPGENRVKIVKTVINPVLWWSWDHGNPNLYQLRARVGVNGKDDQLLDTFGIRELKIAENGQWYLNGKRIFARGMRYMSSVWMGEATEELFCEDLKKMRDLEINAIRIGSNVEKPRFYELCDEMGFLVWQVFPLHYAYSDSDEVIEKASVMMAEMVSLLYNRASIVIWSVFKEPNVYSLEPAPNNYGRLCQIMYETGSTIDPIRWIHKGDYEEGAQHLMTGITQPGEMDFRNIKLQPQAVEFGSGAVAPLETAEEILDLPDRWPPNWDRWFYLNADPRWFRWEGIDPEKYESLEELVEATQNWSARQIKESAEFIRQRKYDPIASMFLYYWNDPYPCLFGSGILDYYRREYRSYSVFHTVYSRILVSIEWIKDVHYVGFDKTYKNGDRVEADIWVTNDTDECVENARLLWMVQSSQKEILFQQSVSITFQADSSEVYAHVSWTIPADAEGGFSLEAQLNRENATPLSQNFFKFTVLK